MRHIIRHIMRHMSQSKRLLNAAPIAAPRTHAQHAVVLRRGRSGVATLGAVALGFGAAFAAYHLISREILPRADASAVTIDCAQQLASLDSYGFDEYTLRLAIAASLRARLAPSGIGLHADAIAALAARFVAERCFADPESYIQWRLGEGDLPSALTMDEYAAGNLDGARASLAAGDPMGNRANGVLHDPSHAGIVVDCALGTVSEPAELGVGHPLGYASSFWHTHSVASGVRELGSAEEAGGELFDRTAETVSIGIALTFHDGTRAPMHLAVGRVPSTGRLCVLGFWRFAPCDESVPTGLNLGF